MARAVTGAALNRTAWKVRPLSDVCQTASPPFSVDRNSPCVIGRENIG
jgi:hypothetical protein